MIRALLILACAIACACRTAAPARFDATLSGYAYPYPVQTFEVATQRQRLAMAYVDVAPTGAANGQIVLLLHGKNFSAAYWAPTIRALAAAGFRVIAPDQIGFGKSAKPERYQFSFEALAHNTRALLESLGITRTSVIGHSMGGMLATRYATLWPERVDKLVLVNPIGLEDYRAFSPPPPIDALYAKELAQTPEKIRAYMREAYFAGNWKPAYEALVEALAGWTQGPDHARVAWNAALTADMIVTQPVVHDFPRITVPTLLVIGQRDRTAIGKDRAPADVAKVMGDYPALGKRTAAAIPGAKLVEIEAGHLPQLEAFEAYAAALLGFLR